MTILVETFIKPGEGASGHIPFSTYLLFFEVPAVYCLTHSLSACIWAVPLRYLGLEQKDFFPSSDTDLDDNVGKCLNKGLVYKGLAQVAYFESIID